MKNAIIYAARRGSDLWAGTFEQLEIELGPLVWSASDIAQGTENGRPFFIAYRGPNLRLTRASDDDMREAEAQAEARAIAAAERAALVAKLPTWTIAVSA